MNEHCKGCVLHYIAGQPKTHPRAKELNDWCCRFGSPANRTVSHCKLMNGKKEDDVRAAHN